MPITRISEQALRALDARPRVSIHSVFDSAVNLRAGPRLIVCTARSLSAPHGLELTSSDVLRLREHAQLGPTAVLWWHSAQRRFSDRAGSLAIAAAPDLAVFDTTLPVGGPDRWPGAIARLVRSLSRRGAVTGFGDDWPALSGDGRFDRAITSIADGRADEAVLYWLGRGPGLTPSGDDVLVGAIATLYSAGVLGAGATAALGRSIQHAAWRTTEISAEYLYYACQGMVAGPLHDLITALGSADDRATASAVNRLRHFGHTSGMDSVLGVVAATRHLATATRTSPDRR